MVDDEEDHRIALDLVAAVSKYYRAWELFKSDYTYDANIIGNYRKAERELQEMAITYGRRLHAIDGEKYVCRD